MRQTQSCTPAFPRTFSNAHSGQFLGGYTSDFVDTGRVSFSPRSPPTVASHHRPRPARNAWENSAGWLSEMSWNLPSKITGSLVKPSSTSYKNPHQVWIFCKKAEETHGCPNLYVPEGISEDAIIINRTWLLWKTGQPRSEQSQAEPPSLNLMSLLSLGIAQPKNKVPSLPVLYEQMVRLEAWRKSHNRVAFIAQSICRCWSIRRCYWWTSSNSATASGARIRSTLQLLLPTRNHSNDHYS